ncbi:ATP-binding cassette domain-containing protein (plasmid) [Salipiger sp. H15]|uniref:ATP-binding cassette domain-containing protein n=1 Tax=Alloyangia sp. H15 TaxID=3029062 RepID=A0AAU8AQK9_9RHOB
MTHYLELDGLALARPPRAGSPGYRLDVSELRIAPGDRIGIVGVSGSGKSTLLDLIALIRRPDEVQRFALMGTEVSPCLTDGRLEALAPLRARSVSYILQDGGLLPYLTVVSNARLARRLAGSREPIEPYAAALGIAALLGKLPMALSGGQRQRAAVLRGLVSGAPILLADEPTAALDDANAQATMALLAGLPEDRAVIVSSHQEALLRANGFRLMRLSVHDHGDGTISTCLADAA